MWVRPTGQVGIFLSFSNREETGLPTREVTHTSGSTGHLDPGTLSVFFSRGGSVSLDWELGKRSNVYLIEEVGLCGGRPGNTYSIRM